MRQIISPRQLSFSPKASLFKTLLNGIFFWITAFVAIVLYGCRKNDLISKSEPPPSERIQLTEFDKLLEGDFFVKDRKFPDAASKRTSIGGAVGFGVTVNSSEPPLNEYPDEVPMVLGSQLNNPYTIPIMTQAYSLYYGYPFSNVPVTHYYVKFSPQNEGQLAHLEDSMELELFDYPLDYEVITDGDYYLQPGKTHEDIPDFYTTVEVGFQFPAGTPYVILAELHLPNTGGTDDMYLEELAESIAEGAAYRSVKNRDGSITVTRTDGSPGAILELPPRPCDPPMLRQGGKLDFADFQAWRCPGGAPGNPGGTPGGTTPGIYVNDTQKGIEPVENIKILTKKWFVIQKTYTNSSGQFNFTKSYSRSAKVILKARNTALSVRPLRSQSFIRLSLLVVKIKLNERYTFNQLASLRYVFEKGTGGRTSIQYMQWLAAHAINSMNYFKQQADIDEVKTMTGHRLCVYLQKGGDDKNRGPEADVTLQNYIFKKRGPGEWIIEVGKLAIYCIAQDWIGAGLMLFENVLSTQKPDIIFRYKTLDENLSSNEINQQFYAAFAKIGTYKAIDANEYNANNSKWKYYFKVKDKMVDFAVGFNGAALKSALKDLGALKFLYQNFTWNIDGTNIGYASVINLSITVVTGIYYHLAQPEREMYDMINGFGEYYGHYLANRKYGTQADAILDQQRKTVFTTTSSSHKNYLETWNPNEQMDDKIDMKVGLFNDLEDAVSSPPERIPQTSIDDLVQGIKASFSQKGIAGYFPGLYYSPEYWYMLRSNVDIAVPGQTNQINLLFQAYNVQ
ncbi:MAG: hypothetical protein K2X48_07210 [Chitinophagaceae bacterium]|nr:hypothetical protein [Chitinophagaceae bacterium]